MSYGCSLSSSAISLKDPDDFRLLRSFETCLICLVDICFCCNYDFQTIFLITFLLRTQILRKFFRGSWWLPFAMTSQDSPVEFISFIFVSTVTTIFKQFSGYFIYIFFTGKFCTISVIDPNDLLHSINRQVRNTKTGHFDRGRYSVNNYYFLFCSPRSRFILPRNVHVINKYNKCYLIVNTIVRVVILPISSSVSYRYSRNY